tara:strand:- start:738 stop:2045 length:1308 start_codon:yes stop_codon:yes gene_type:complete
METFKIKGGFELNGEITPQGAKNEALQVICAAILTDDKVVINNIPAIVDVKRLINLLSKLGVNVQKLTSNSYSFQSNNINLDYLDSKEFKKDGQSLRGSIMIVGPLLTRFGKGCIPKPGGDKIGRRRLDTHFQGLVKLGGKFSYKRKDHFYTVKADKLKGTYILLDEASVTGTANILMAAVLAEGKTTIYNAACEPYIQQLCKMLINMGANINGMGSNLLIIEGVKELKGTEHTVLPDMIEIGSWIGLAAMTKSEILIKNVSWENLGQIPNVFNSLGIDLIKKGDDMLIPKHNDGYEIKNDINGSILTVSDAPWPGFSPDLLSVVLVVATQARGSVLIHQKMFESRLFFVDKLIDMGAKIILCDPHRATVIGHAFNSKLKATSMTSPDIRAGISLLIAALSAEGTSTINNIEQIDRGYENIDQRLRSIGAKIKRI